jgi:ribonuclease HI
LAFNTDQEATAILIWDPDVIASSDDLFKPWTPPTEILVVQTRSKGQTDPKGTNATRTSQSKLTLDRPRTPFAPEKNPISIHTHDSPKLYYNVVEYLKKLKANVLVMDICRIPQQKYLLLQALSSVENLTTSDVQEKNLPPMDSESKPTINTYLEGRKERPFVPPFLLTFEDFNKNLHNCLVDSKASSNVMPLAICNKLGIVPLKHDKNFIQMDMTQVKVMGEIKDVMIRVATHPNFVQVINIIVVDIPEAYGLLLSRYWSEKLNGYFNIEWAHLWLPLKGYKNMIIIDREIYLKHTVTDLETPNEPASTDFPIPGNYSCDSHFGNFFPLLSDVSLTQSSEMIFQEEFPMPREDSLFFQDLVLGLPKEKIEERNTCWNGNHHSQIWTLYFDGSKSQEGSGAGCILIDQKGKNYFLSCRIEFECTNNTVEYEALVQGLNKGIDLDVKELKVFRDSEIIIRQVRNTIHCNSPHLKNYQQEVQRLIECFEAFNITAIPRVKNILADSLATAASRLLPLEDYEASRFIVELLYKPSVPNNVSNWKVFEGDEQIISFLTNQENFKDLAIDGEEFQEKLMETSPQEGQHADKPKAHTIPKGIENLENLFDLKK